jgi:hypothetical protein
MAVSDESFESVIDASLAVRRERERHQAAAQALLWASLEATSQRATAQSRDALVRSEILRGVPDMETRPQKRQNVSVSLASLIRADVKDFALSLHAKNLKPATSLHYPKSGDVRDCAITDRGKKHTEFRRPGTLYPTAPAWILAKMEYTFDKSDYFYDNHENYGYYTGAYKSYALRYGIGAYLSGELFIFSQKKASDIEEPYQIKHANRSDLKQVERRVAPVLITDGPISDGAVVPPNFQMMSYADKWHAHLLKYAECVAGGMMIPPPLSFDPR